jgi:hypothetical protein
VGDALLICIQMDRRTDGRTHATKLKGTCKNLRHTPKIIYIQVYKSVSERSSTLSDA